mgnify:FL=1
MFGFGNRKAGDNKNIFVDAYGVVRTVPGLPGTDTSGLKLEDIDATPQLIDYNRGQMLLAPGGFEQSQRVLGLQQAADERAKLARLSEDDYKFLTQVEKDRLQRTAQIVDARQRIATRGALIQQGQLGNQQLAQQSGQNRGQVMGQAPTLQ